jgi:hypothetical protein
MSSLGRRLATKNNLEAHACISGLELNCIQTDLKKIEGPYVTTAHHLVVINYVLHHTTPSSFGRAFFFGSVSKASSIDQMI